MFFCVYDDHYLMYLFLSMIFIKCSQIWSFFQHNKNCSLLIESSFIDIKGKTWKVEMIKMLQGREECDTYLTHVYRLESGRCHTFPFFFFNISNLILKFLMVLLIKNLLQFIHIYLYIPFCLVWNWRDQKRTGTHKHTETVSRYFDWHSHLSQSKESKCLWTHDKDGVTREFTKGATRTVSRR